MRSLRGAGHEVCAVVPSRNAYGARSRAASELVFAPEPGLRLVEFIAPLRHACDRLRPAALLPGTERTLVAVAECSDEFPDVALGVPALDVVKLATDKARVVELARQVGLRVPPTEFVDRDDAVRAAEAVGYPIVVKPVRSELVVDGDLLHVSPQFAADRAAFDTALASVPGDRVLVQRYLSSTLGAVCGVAWNGRIVCTSHQTAKRIWPTPVGVMAFAVTVARDPAIDESLAPLFERLGWSGIFQVQFLRAGDAVYLIDLNPRIYASLALTLTAGLDLPTIWVDLLTGGSPRISDYSIGVRYRRAAQDARAIAHGLRHGPRGASLLGMLPRRRTTHLIWRLDDVRPAITSLENLVVRARNLANLARPGKAG
jgi:biotin carboxylase